MQAQVHVIVRRDTRAWRVQVWVSFAIALTMCASGLFSLPGKGLEQAFMIMGYIFCMSAVFALSKFVRDRELQRADTPMWSLVVWGGFAVAMALTGWGLWHMDIGDNYKAYLLVSWLFLISSVFTLAKTLRDAHEADLAEARQRGSAAPSDAGLA